MHPTAPLGRRADNPRASLPSAIALVGVLVALAAQATGAAVCNAPQEQDDAYQTAHARYAECIHRLPFRFHTQGREALARTRDLRALEILTTDYRKPGGEWQDHARYTLATMYARYFDDSDAVDAFAQLRVRHKKASDAWLWTKTLTVHCNHRDGKAATAAIQDNKNIALRAAAIVGMVRGRDRGVLDLIPGVCAELPKKAGPRRMLVSAMSEAILKNRHLLGEERFKVAARAYINLLGEDTNLVHSTKMVIARHLTRTFDKSTLFINPEPWLAMLESKAASKPSSSRTIVASRFFGVEAEGDRICYVVDMSDSMCKEIDPGLLKEKPTGPLTGPRRKKRKRLKRGEIPDENDIPWHLIKTRWDLAREQLRISLLRLTPDKRFCVVYFGMKAGTLNACKGMIKASRGNVQRVLRELDAIKPGPPKPPDAPDGTLLGRTNMHAGLRLAFALRPKGAAEAHEYVDLKAAELGTDTIFLVSDGAPSWDDFAKTDKYYKGEGRIVRDTEYAKEVPPTDRVNYHGPYVWDAWLVEEVKRMNVFRRAQIHCIGIGEAKLPLLRSIAKSAMGEVFLFGAKAKKAGKK